MEISRNQHTKNELVKKFISQENDMIQALRQKNDNDGYIMKIAEIRERADSTIAAQNLTFKFSDVQREIYTTIGGTPHLDGEYSVFGEVISGMEVVDKIAAVETNANDRPLKDVKMVMKLIKK
jgi:cyclophilin family peptidyl-prolyl cis-trans isomerase